mgnify:CR=1 FL=1
MNVSDDVVGHVYSLSPLICRIVTAVGTAMDPRQYGSSSHPVHAHVQVCRPKNACASKARDLVASATSGTLNYGLENGCHQLSL